MQNINLNSPQAIKFVFSIYTKAMAPRSSTLAWKILRTEEPGRLQSMGSLRVGHNSVTSFSLFTFMHWRRKWQSTPAFLPGKSHGGRSLIGYSPWGRKESDTTERLHFHFSLSCIGEWNGNPVQYSCLENPRDGGAWWAAVYGVAQSRTGLKRLSSSSKGYVSWDCLSAYKRQLLQWCKQIEPLTVFTTQSLEVGKQDWLQQIQDVKSLRSF